MQEILKRLRIIKLCIDSNNSMVLNLQKESINKYLIDDALQQILNDAVSNSTTNIISRIDDYISDNKNSKKTFELNESVSGEIEKSNYSIKLEDLKNPTFEKIRRVSMNYIEAEDESDKNNYSLYEYMDKYGKRDKALLYSSFDAILEELVGDSINIIDWGSEQSLASSILLDYIREKQLDVKVENIILISKVKNKLSRGILHCNILKNNQEKIIGINKSFESVSDSEFGISNNSIIINLIYNTNMSNFTSIINSQHNNYLIALSTTKDDDKIDQFIQCHKEKYRFNIISKRNDKIGRFQRSEAILSKRNSDIPDERWIERLWEWADENNLPNLIWIDNIHYDKGGYWGGLPRDREKLLNLTSLNISHNKLTELSKEIGYLTKLEELNLSYNKLKILPESVCNLKNLQKFNFAMNLNLVLTIKQIKWIKNLKEI